jgi:hypothetical protein
MTAALAHRPSVALKADGDRYTWLDVLRTSNGVREAMMHAGVAPRFEDLAGWEFGGGNSPPIYRLIGIRKFCKGFYRGPARAERGPEPYIQGYNIDVQNNGDGDLHLLKPSRSAPKRYGFYRVHRPIEGARDNRYPNSLLLDYSLGGNGLFGPPLRDYVVQIYPDDPDLLLGKAYLSVLGLRIPANFFVLKRLHRHTFEG